MSTVLTDSGVLYVTDDGKHVIQGPMYDVGGAQPVNVTNALLVDLVEPEDISNAIVWLASDDSKMVTGQCIPVDGGMIMLG